MTNPRIQLRRKTRADILALGAAAPGEPIFATDTHELFFGTGTGIEPLQFEAQTGQEFTFAYGDATPTPIYTMITAGTLWRVVIAIDVAFDGVGAALTLGDAGDADRLMAANQNDPSAVAVYATEPARAYADGDQIIFTITPGAGATQGSGRIQLIF